MTEYAKCTICKKLIKAENFIESYETDGQRIIGIYKCNKCDYYNHRDMNDIFNPINEFDIQ